MWRSQKRRDPFQCPALPCDEMVTLFDGRATSQKGFSVQNERTVKLLLAGRTGEVDCRARGGSQLPISNFCLTSCGSTLKMTER